MRHTQKANGNMPLFNENKPLRVNAMRPEHVPVGGPTLKQIRWEGWLKSNRVIPFGACYPEETKERSNECTNGKGTK